MSTREKALAVLNQYGIPYTLEEHDPVYTCLLYTSDAADE